MTIDETLSIFPPLESLSLDLLYLCYSLVIGSAAYTPSDKFGIWSDAVRKVEDAITANITASVLAPKETL